MAKRTKAIVRKNALRRTSTMVKAVAEGEKFLAQTKKKKVTRTRTMAQTIKEGQQIISRKVKRQSQREESPSQSVQPQAKSKGNKKKKITKRAVTKKVVAVKQKNGKSTDDKKSDKKDSKKSKVSKSSASVRSVRPSIKATSNLPQNMKKTIFKTKSRDHLPIPAFGFIDVCFCIDATGSMGSQLAQAQSTILSIIHNIENKVQTEGLTLRFAVVSYRDHPPQDPSYVTRALDFTDGHEAGEYVKKLQAFGGGDFPEAVHDGLMHCCKNLNWVELPGTPILRYIFHIADAPPHGKQFGNIIQTNQGCLCGMRIAEIYHEINLRQIHFRLIKARAGQQLLEMQAKFKAGIVDFQSTDLAHAKEMDVKVSDMIIHEVIGNM